MQVVVIQSFQPQPQHVSARDGHLNVFFCEKLEYAVIRMCVPGFFYLNENNFTLAALNNKSDVAAPEIRRGQKIRMATSSSCRS